MPLGGIRPSHPAVTALAATFLHLGPSTVWAHGEVPSQWTTPGPTSLWILLFVALLASICVVGHLRFQSRLHRLCRQTSRTVPWAALGLLSVHLIALPPHLVHHLAGPPDERAGCTLFVQASTNDQERAEPVMQVVSLSRPGTMADSPAPPPPVFPIPTPSGRSPPGPWI